MNTSGKRVCIFVDGENLRHSLGDLLPSFSTADYLPRADWGKFFDWIARDVGGADAERIRTYWYVVQNIDYTPFNLSGAVKDKLKMAAIIGRDGQSKKRYDEADPKDRGAILEAVARELQITQEKMSTRFAGWTHIQDTIAGKFKAIEFRRAGSIRYSLFDKKLGSEKAVDVKLATDLIKLKDIYDIAVIVSGDQDYVPAVDTVKDMGKHVVSVAFKTELGTLLPGGAKRLNQSTDWHVEVEHTDLVAQLDIPKEAVR